MLGTKVMLFLFLVQCESKKSLLSLAISQMINFFYVKILLKLKYFTTQIG